MTEITVKLTKQDEKRLADNIVSMVFDLIGDDIGWEMAEDLLKSHKKQIQKEVKKIMDSRITEIAEKIVEERLRRSF